MGTPYDVVFFAPDSFPGKIKNSLRKKVPEDLDLKTDNVYISSFV